MSHSEKHLIRKRIASRVAQELKDGDIVNLGIGLPTLVANEVDKDIEILMQAENGLLGIDELADENNQDPDLVNAGAQPITAIEGACYFNSADSFAIIRGGHVDATVLVRCRLTNKGIWRTGSFRARWYQEWAVQWIWLSVQKGHCRHGAHSKRQT